MRTRSRAASTLIWVIGGYRRFVSPLLGSHCRFYPSCSAYGQEALAIHGLVRGGWLAVRRLGRCHPWNPGGIDRVPARADEAPAEERLLQRGPRTGHVTVAERAKPESPEVAVP